MPHSIRDYYLNTTLTSGNYSSSSYSSSSTSDARGYTSSFNTTYSINPSTLPSYSYTNRFLQQQRAATAAAPASSGSARMSQYPPPQHQHYHSTPSGGPSNNGSSAGPGYSSTYAGGGNSDRYNSSYSGHHMSSTGPGASGGTHSKTVCRMDCRYCSAVVCLRGMKAMLLADTTVELYSTDHPPGSVQLIDKDYTTSNCKCKIRDVACRVCGNVIGYHITQPCQQCLRAPNNGHFWMFHTEGVVGQERLSLDLAKLVQELVTFPHQAHHDREHASTLRTEGATSNNTTNTTGHRVENQTGAAAEAATSRQTSDSILQRQQQQTLSRQRLLTTSPSPATPTPSALQPTTNDAPLNNSIASTNTPTPATGHVHSEAAADTSSDPPASADSSPERPLAALPTESSPADLETEPPLYSAAAALAQLHIAMFLQPMKWEQLPHPDLDIDLDPGTMGGEPLFSTQWVELVKHSAETAAANMTLALDQEEETERFVQRMQLEDHMLDQLEGSEASEDHVQEQGDDDVTEIESEVEAEVEMEVGDEAEEPAHVMEIEELIDQVDSFGLAITSPITPERNAEDSKDDDPIDLDMGVDGEPTRGRRRAPEHQVQSAQPGEAPPPGQEGPTLSRRPASIGRATPLPPTAQSSPEDQSSRSISRSSESTVQLSPESCPTIALASAMIAKAAASAAAADAASSANNLLFGRRSRRDYDMIEEKQIEALKAAQAAIENLNERVPQGKPPTKELFKNVGKIFRGGF
ncbi:Protein fam72a [Mortierella antarctica]|nr:Protein fam72a [Mortierella antarctica]